MNYYITENTIEINDKSETKDRLTCWNDTNQPNSCLFIKINVYLTFYDNYLTKSSSIDI